MLSYQHGYHAGNLADVHKHAVLAWVLDYLTRKDKPLSYLETHAGRGLYNLADAAALKTGEAAKGVSALLPRFPSDHPYARAVEACRRQHGAATYPGSPLVAGHFLRASDRCDLAELHPAEADALAKTVQGGNTRLHRQDGFAMAKALLPPTPRRGLMLIDPSYEVKADYEALPRHIARYAQVWNVGVVMLWYPLLKDERHLPMLDRLRVAAPDALCHEVRFAPAREGHGMHGSGLFILRPPFGLLEACQQLGALFEGLAARGD
jgi:23S rRNA (adenine2030-N6)-methyltransferase